jgi:hypothetical protein
LEKLLVVTKEFLNRYQQSIDQGIDDYDLIDNTIDKPLKEEYKTWDEYYSSLIVYMKEKYRYTYGSKA